MTTPRTVRLPTGLHIYVAGFQCTPFSLRHTDSRCFAEADAAVFYAICEYLQQARPSIAILENVKGLERTDPDSGERCLDIVIRRLHAIGHYSVDHMLLDPRDFGYPICRPRFCFSYYAAMQSELAARVLSRAWRP
jgi:site-specific DNA-cytosine methylase